MRSQIEMSLFLTHFSPYMLLTLSTPGPFFVDNLIAGINALSYAFHIILENYSKIHIYSEDTVFFQKNWQPSRITMLWQQITPSFLFFNVYPTQITQSLSQDGVDSMYTDKQERESSVFYKIKSDSIKNLQHN